MKKTLLLLLVACPVLALAEMSDSNGRVAVIGTGMMGGAMGTTLAKQGYSVTYGSRNPQRHDVQELVSRTAGAARAVLPEQAVADSDMVVLAVPWPAMETVAKSLGDLGGKLVLDVSNPMGPGEDGYQRRLVETSSAELIQEWNPGARVVKAFNAVGYFVIENPAAANGPVSVPVASDHHAEKCLVMEIVRNAGLDAVDAGPLRHAHMLEGMAILYMTPFSHRELDNGYEFYFRRNSFWQPWSEAMSDEERTAWNKAEPPAPGYRPCN
ncbi:MAG: NAD(P)-binding domain-containing protein [Gammaproteobacteria bacterium]|nr:NAD(P)-binding domain-containing protein [Gammaproteobacteria bacterium]